MFRAARVTRAPQVAPAAWLARVGKRVARQLDKAVLWEGNPPPPPREACQEAPRPAHKAALSRDRVGQTQGVPQQAGRGSKILAQRGQPRAGDQVPKEQEWVDIRFGVVIEWGAEQSMVVQASQRFVVHLDTAHPWLYKGDGVNMMPGKHD